MVNVLKNLYSPGMSPQALAVKVLKDRKSANHRTFD